MEKNVIRGTSVSLILGTAESDLPIDKIIQDLSLPFEFVVRRARPEQAIYNVTGFQIIYILSQCDDVSIVNDLLGSCLDPLEPKRLLLQSVCEHYALNAWFCIGIYIDNMLNLFLDFDSDVLEKLYSFGVCKSDVVDIQLHHVHQKNGCPKWLSLNIK